MLGRIKIILSVLIIGGAAAYLGLITIKDSEALTYYFVADEVMAKPEAEAIKGQKIRLGGYVEECSILQKKGTLEYQFEVRPDPPRAIQHPLKYPQMKGKTITVAYTGITPDTFKDQAEVIVTGRLLDDGTFAGQDLTAKCPSKYEAAEKGMTKPEPVDCEAKLRARRAAAASASN